MFWSGIACLTPKIFPQVCSHSLTFKLGVKQNLWRTDQTRVVTSEIKSDKIYYYYFFKKPTLHSALIQKCTLWHLAYHNTLLKIKKINIKIPCMNLITPPEGILSQMISSTWKVRLILHHISWFSRVKVITVLRQDLNCPEGRSDQVLRVFKCSSVRYIRIVLALHCLWENLNN